MMPDCCITALRLLDLGLGLQQGACQLHDVEYVDPLFAGAVRFLLKVVLKTGAGYTVCLTCSAQQEGKYHREIRRRGRYQGQAGNANDRLPSLSPGV